ncbi:peptide transporter ptr2 [Penicillium verhagenii]|nr:peptide transporter ptr2 [Penicillium verhagenii]
MDAPDRIETTETSKPVPMLHGSSEKLREVKLEEAKTIDSALSGDIVSIPPAGNPIQKVYPTDEDLRSLRRIPGSISWVTYGIAFVELCERFSYYGTTAVFVNFIQRPLPQHSTTGALVAGTDFNKHVPGALGMGQRASTALTLFNQFWAYTMPLVGAFIADQYWGRYRTIVSSLALTFLGHAILVVSAIPKAIENSHGAIACFSIGIIIMGLGTGGYKSNISPLIAEQYRDDKPYIKVLPSGERVIVDPTTTVARIFNYFYMMINVGSLVGQIAMVYAERYVGFWLSFFLPTLMFCLCPAVLLYAKNRYYHAPPSGSVYPQAFRLWRFKMKGRWSLNLMKLLKKKNTSENSWDRVKPSRLGPEKPQWMNFDDAWVDEVRRGFKACGVFVWLPLYWLAYNQEMNNLTSQAATMSLGGVPNDIINNLNPITLIIFIPIMDLLVYPALRRRGIKFTALKRITTGFFLAGCSMIAAAVTQHYIYKDGPCGKDANYCLEKEGKHTNISVWVQAVPYVLGGISEIFTSITVLEYAFTKAPRNMRSLVSAMGCVVSAVSAALGQAFVALADDPLLEWNYGVTAILAFVGCVGFWLTHRQLDSEEDKLNMLPEGHFVCATEHDVEEAK